MPSDKKLLILHVTSEVVPYSKTGGLADVLNGLPKAQATLGHKVYVVSPLYDAVDRARHGIKKLGKSVSVTLGGRSFDFQISKADMGDGATALFLRNDDLFGRPQLYGNGNQDYEDNHIRFGSFSAAIFELVRELGLAPDIIHCHDWQTGLVPAFNRLNSLNVAPTVTTIHNLAYQGQFPADVLPELGISWDVFNPEGLEFYGRVNFLKAGIVWSNKITTVSPNYAQEVLRPEFGAGLDGVLRAKGGNFTGILNGADYSIWDPRNDPYIASSYGPDDLSGKQKCREHLLEKVGLKGVIGPIFGVVGRFASQKGFDLIAQVIPSIVAQGGIVVVLGSGEESIQKAMSAVADAFPNRVALKIGYDEELAHQIEAGSDFFLMPSRYEPCGLNQIYSLRYGTLPIVHSVGGLKDTVVDLCADPENGTGFVFHSFDAGAFLQAILNAFGIYNDKPRLLAARLRGMAKDFSWGQSAKAYLQLYRQAMKM